VGGQVIISSVIIPGVGLCINIIFVDGLRSHSRRFHSSFPSVSCKSSCCYSKLFEFGSVRTKHNFIITT
jgi:hypothetical protein